MGDGFQPLIFSPLTITIAFQWSRPLLFRSLVTATTESAEGSSGVGSLVTTRVLNVVLSED